METGETGWNNDKVTAYSHASVTPYEREGAVWTVLDNMTDW
jgi:hypothetical protein